MTEAPDRDIQTLSVYRAEHLRVVNGANLGDALGFADELQPDDIYRLSPFALPEPMAVRVAAGPPFRIAPGGTGTPGAALHLDCCLTFMSGDGRTTECLVLVETDAAGHAVASYAMPLAVMRPRADYVLVGVGRKIALQRFAQLACTSFTEGTAITLASGEQRAVEALKVGDRVLTRDDGAQPIRWLGSHTLRATGTFAPVRIRAGTLNNSRDLVVSPDFRLFIYQRQDHLGAGRAEIMVRARHLVNGDTVERLAGGFVTYYQMLFDAHQIVYAEGVAVESLLVDRRTSAMLPAAFQDRLAELIPGHRRTDHRGLEVQEALLARPDAAEILRKSSGG